MSDLSPAGLLPPVSSAGSSGDEDMFALHWENFSASFSQPFGQLLCTPETKQLTVPKDVPFTDIVLLPGDDPSGRPVRAHRVVLAAGSAYLNKLLLQMYSCTSSQQQSVLCLQGVSNQDLQEILHFLYRGSVHIQQHRLQHFLNVATRFQIKGLTNDAKFVKNDKIKLARSVDKPPRKRHAASKLDAGQKHLQTSPSISSQAAPPALASPALIPSTGQFVKEEPEEELEEEEEDDEVLEDDLYEDNNEPEQFLQNVGNGAFGSKNFIANPVPGPSDTLFVERLFPENTLCHFCRVQLPDKAALLDHLRSVHQPDRHVLCENCENFFHICSINRHRVKCLESLKKFPLK